MNCESLSSSSRRMLLTQKLHDAGCTKICFPNRSEGIPDWFEHQSRGDTISFWFRKKIPSLTCIIVIPGSAEIRKFNLFLNDNEITLPGCFFNYEEDLQSGHAFLFDLKLDQHINKCFERKPELYEAFKNNDWNHVELKWKICQLNDMKKKEMKILSSGAELGIHVSWKEKSNTEGDVRFTNPDSRMREADEYHNASETESLHQREIYPLQSLSSGFFSQKLSYIKILTLENSQHLTHIPNVSGLRNLERFSFEYCCNLITTDNSIGKLNKLEVLSAKYCCKLESIPPLHLPCLQELELSFCKSLKSFPELLCKMTNIKEIKFCNTSIGEFPFSLPLSFQYLSELEYLQVNRVRMLRFPKHDDKMNPIVFSNMYSVILRETSLSDECLPILLKWFVNVTSLNLMDNNFKILPECLSECHHLGELVLDDCKFLEEIRGFPPNLAKFSAVGCVSLSLASRRRLLSQDLSCTKISFPNGSEGIPDWFEHQIRGDTISLWFSKKIPTITCIFLIPRSVELPQFNLFLNDKEITLADCLFHYDCVLPLEHAFLCDLNLNSSIYETFANKPELYEAIKNNEWNHVELKWEICYVSDTEEGEKEIKIFRSGAQMGIHVSWDGADFSDTEVEKSNKEGDVRFTNPYNK